VSARAGIVVTGTEVLTGRVGDRNGPWLAERLLNDGLQELSHLTHATDQACSFCGTEHSVECVTGGNAIMCRACVDMMMA